MYTQKIFQAGNSSVVAIPKELLKKLDLKPGQSIVIKADPDAARLIIETSVPGQSVDKSASTKEFHDWLDIFMEENSEILDELAKH
jgi:antitoxin component of MazEF toxin-antitoxin module